MDRNHHRESDAKGHRLLWNLEPQLEMTVTIFFCAYINLRQNTLRKGMIPNRAAKAINLKPSAGPVPGQALGHSPLCLGNSL